MRKLIAAVVALVAVLIFAGSFATQAEAKRTKQVHYFGVIYRDNGGTWRILNDAGHRSRGLMAVSVAPDGTLVLRYAAVRKVGGFQISSDETYAGIYFPGASVGTKRAFIKIRKDGQYVRANDIPSGGNLWVDLTGWK
jgi:hypothetical protein